MEQGDDDDLREWWLAIGCEGKDEPAETPKVIDELEDSTGTLNSESLGEDLFKVDADSRRSWGLRRHGRRSRRLLSCRELFDLLLECGDGIYQSL